MVLFIVQFIALLYLLHYSVFKGLRWKELHPNSEDSSLRYERPLRLQVENTWPTLSALKANLGFFPCLLGDGISNLPGSQIT